MSTITFDFRHHYQRGERRESEQIAYQWDLGHVMEVFVPEDATYTIGYCFGDYEKTEDYAIDAKVQEQDGSYKLTAHIPNKYFERSRELRVYVVGSADDHIITTYEGFITIRGRIQPDDYVDDDPENGATQIIEEARKYATKAQSYSVGGTGTREGENTDNAKYYLEEAQRVADSIPEDYSELSDNVDQLKNALTTKAEQDGAYLDLTAGQMLSKNEASDSVPYNFRTVGQNATLEYTDAIVGGSVVQNQQLLGIDKIGANKWQPYSTSYGTISYANGELTYTLNDVRSDAWANGIESSPFIKHKDHIVFISHDIYVPKACSVNASYFQGTNPVDASVGWNHIDKIEKTNSSNDGVSITNIFGIRNASSAGYVVGDTYKIKNAMFIDVTQALGSTIADYVYTLETATTGSGVAWLKKHFPKLFAYQEYNAGEIVSVQGLSQHVTVGFNQCDEIWEVGNINGSTGEDVVLSDRIRNKNYNRCLPSTDYYIRCSLSTNELQIAYYDANKAFILKTARLFNRVITTPQNAYYFRIVTSGVYGNTYKNDICLNLSDPAKNGIYEPYVKRTYPLDNTKTFRGILKLDSNNNLYADGDRYLPDGTVRRRYAVIDLGTLTWTYDSQYSRFYAGIPSMAYHAVRTSSFICPRYQCINDGRSLASVPDKSIYNGDQNVYITDSAYTDASAFKTAMSGVYLLYELGTSTTETADPYTVPQVVDSNGTEEFVSTSIVPVGHKSRYPDDLRAKIDGLPWNLSMIAPIENGEKASQAYAVDKYFLHNNKLCKAKTSIAQGATFTLGTNYDVTTVADELYAALH